MADIFGTDIAGEIADAFSGQLIPLTLASRTAGTRTAGNLTGGTNPTTATATGEGIIDDYTNREIDGTRVRTGDKKILIIGKSLSPLLVPKPGDDVTIEGSTYRIIRVKRDPAAATYTCQSRN